MFKQAKWISCEKFETPVIIREFIVDEFESAAIDITGLGYFEAYINDIKLCDDMFIPAYTDYHIRNTEKFSYPIVDKTHYRINYLTFDITKLLRRGRNILRIILGNGWYRQQERTAEGDMRYGDDLKALYEIGIKHGDSKTVVCSDGSELYGRHNILQSNLFIGETIDARCRTEYTERVKLTSVENTTLTLQMLEPDRVVAEISPKLIYSSGNEYIYDNGVNVTGLVSVETDCPAGEEIVLQFSENLNEEKTGLDFSSCGGDGQIQQDRFIGNGEHNCFTPKFTFHCFRYFKITGKFSSVKTLVIHTDVTDVSEFECDDPTLNWLYKAFKRTFLNNLHGGIPSDCPHRERLGYTGDGQLTAEAAMYCFDLSKSYRKWITDIFDGQGENGHIQHTAPLQGGGGGPACWGGAAVMLPYQYYKFYGDKDFLAENYPKICRWIEYIRSRTENGLVVREEERGWCLGDWGFYNCSARIEPAFVNSAFFVYLLGLASELAEVLGQGQDIEKFSRYKEEYESAVIVNYYDPDTGDFCKNEQFANVFGLYIGLGCDKTFENVCKAIDNCGEILDIGIQGMDILIKLLFERGDADRALRAIEVLFKHMMERGATTVWEYPYDQNVSNCHHMFCGLVRSIFSEMLGIRIGFGGEISLSDPKLPSGISYVKGMTVVGGKTIAAEYKRESGKVIRLT